MTRILLVEDDRLLREWSGELLARSGFEVVLAADGDACLQQMKGADFDLLVLDLVMPLMSGFEVLAELERRKIRVPTIVTSGIVIPGVHDYLKTHEHVRLLSKPFDRAALLACIRELLSEARRGGPA